MKAHGAYVFYAVRTYSPKNKHGQKQELWKVLSRPMKSRDECKLWINFEKTQQKNPENYDWAVVKIVEHNI